ncbi:hypothetical protein GALMADRAFT_218667 [Galerina marginata CBS 339.88]|uniref:ubiquitinyl hydrolase 1 n=1 Tax=Galerina marginata (strain CBS 339.88) TaxID=685588 RepID=A0A067TQX6_GALM3|nr:hypothetical protein GALMADRAFT_218667 [Galerina marginata CBS 339.88]
MARSRWISLPARDQLRLAAKKATAIPSVLPLLSTADAKKFGLENVICYANSVLQALYFCTPFRDLLLQDIDTAPPQDNSPVIPPPPIKSATPLVPVRRKPERKPSSSGHAVEPSTSTPAQTSLHPIPSSPPTLFSALQSLFLNISTNPGEKGTVSPRAFIDKLKELNDIFRSTMHQDAHEFLNYLLNQIVDEIEEERKSSQNGGNGEDLSNSVATLGSKTPPTVLTADSSNSGTHPHGATLVHKLFEGTLTSETRCLTCETVSSRDESFLDLSIDIEQNSSVTACLRQFSASEMLCQKNKFFCDSCCDLQEAEKRMKIKKLPNVLALHLKRFKYQEDVGKYIKLAYRVAFPFDLRLFNTVDDIDDADRLYNLFAIVVHIGNGPHHGHYISIIKTVGTWLVFDDDNVYPIPESDIPKYFGDSNSGSAYVLYYQAVDIDLGALGLHLVEPPAPIEAFANATPVFGSSAFQDQRGPALPPGLNPVSIPNGDTDAVYSLSPAPQPPATLSQEKPPLTPVAIPIPQSTDLPPLPATIPAASSSPMTPTSFGNKIFGTIRRAPSVTAVRGPTPSVGNAPVNGNEARRSLADRSPRPSISTPSFVAKLDNSTPEPPPPVPPLPPNVASYTQLPITTTSPVLTLLPHVHEPEDKEKEKDKKPSSWISGIKRKSLRLTDKSRHDRSPTRGVPVSPIQRMEETQHSHTNWFKPSPSNTNPRPQRRPSDNGSTTVTPEIFNLHPDPSKMKSSYVPVAKHDPKLNGYDDSYQPGSSSSSPSSNSLLNTTQASATGSTTRPSTSSTTSGPQLDFPPPRKSSLAPSSADWSRTSFEPKRSLDTKIVSSSSPPSTSSPHTPQTTSIYYNQNLSPLPSTPKYQSPYRSNITNGDVLVGEPESTVKGKWRSTDADSIGPAPGTTVGAGSLRTLPPMSLAASVGANNSSGSTTSSSNLKRATRKLSLTAPMLGFGKRDKDKDKDREKERASPNTYNRF